MSSGSADEVTETVPWWNPREELLRPGKFDSMLVVAPRQEGKTVLIRHLIRRVVRRTPPARGGFDRVFVISNNDATLRAYAAFVPAPRAAAGESSPSPPSTSESGSESGASSEPTLPNLPRNLINAEADPHFITRLMALQNKLGRRAPRVLVIADDVVGDSMRSGSAGSLGSEAQRLFTQGRHSRIAVWLVVQAWTREVSPTMRKNSDLCVFLRNRSGAEIKTIVDEVLTGALAPEDPGEVVVAGGTRPTTATALARAILAKATTEWGLLVVDWRVKSLGAAALMRRYRVPAAEAARA